YLLYTVVGRRALYFALAPTLAIYATLNLDLLPVALATGGTVAYLRRRDVTSGVLLGFSAAAKLYPALLVIPSSSVGSGAENPIEGSISSGPPSAPGSRSIFRSRSRARVAGWSSSPTTRPDRPTGTACGSSCASGRPA